MAVADSLKKRKIAVLGSRSVGKSALVLQFIENHFVENYYPTIESTFQKAIKHRGAEFDCDVIDTAGQDEFSILNSNHAIGIHGFVLVYSVTSRNSFEMIQIIYDKIASFCGAHDDGIPCVIVGSKTDLAQGRQVDPAEGAKLAEANRAAWIETSAKNDHNIGQVFELCVAEIEKRSKQNQSSDKKSSRSGSCIIM